MLLDNEEEKDHKKDSRNKRQMFLRAFSQREETVGEMHDLNSVSVSPQTSE